jgi:hypothetical protein
MIENLWALPHLPNSTSRWCAMRFEGSPTGDSSSKSSKWRVSPAKWVDFSRKHRDLTWFNQEKWIKNAEPRGFQQKTCGFILHDLIKKPCIKMVYVRPCTLFQPSAMPEAVAATSPLPSFRSWTGGRRTFKTWEDLQSLSPQYQIDSISHMMPYGSYMILWQPCGSPLKWIDPALIGGISYWKGFILNNPCFFLGRSNGNLGIGWQAFSVSQWIQLTYIECIVRNVIWWSSGETSLLHEKDRHFYNFPHLLFELPVYIRWQSIFWKWHIRFYKGLRKSSRMCERCFWKLSPLVLNGVTYVGPVYPSKWLFSLAR